MAEIEIDGKIYQVNTGDSLLSAALSLGLDLPYFCWHPSLGSVGACRQCAVIQYQKPDDREGRLIMACMTPVADGMRISLEHPQAKQFRAGVIELLMTNHPHDCPVCEEGGECHLQDMTVMSGHTFRRYRGKKRTHRNQYLGPFINHEMNRCIACYRCVRYYRDYAGGSDLDVFGAHHHVYFGRHEDGVLENEFSGNLVEVCPTGVFTDKTFSARYTRKWDLQTAPSVCVHCGVGCNTSPGERYGELRRIVNRYHGEINGYFLCDRGRFGYGFVNSERRIRHPSLSNRQPISFQGSREEFAAFVRDAEMLIGIGSPRASLEANFALRELVGAERFYAGINEKELELIRLILEIVQNGPVRIASLKETEAADAVLILGEDITHTAPRLALSLRQAVRNQSFATADRLKIPRWQDAAVREAAQQERSPLFILSCAATRLDDVAAATLRGRPDDLARLGFAVAHRLNPEAPAVENLDPDQENQAETIAAALRSAQMPLIVSGVSSRSRALLEAASNIASALSALRGNEPTAAHFIVPECNSLGLAMMGGRSLEQAFAIARQQPPDVLVILENDLYRRAERSRIDPLLAFAGEVIVIDHIAHGTSAKATLTLPCGAFAETEGTLVSAEGRAQRFFSVSPAEGEIQDAWRWLRDAMGATWRNIDEVTRACAAAIPIFAPIVEAAPSAQFRLAGQKIPRQPHRYSGRTAMLANVRIHEPKTRIDEDSALTYSMEGVLGPLPPALNAVVWAPGWNSNHALNKFQDEVGGPLRGGDPGVRLIHPKAAARVRWFDEIPAAVRKPHRRWTLTPLHHIFGSEELSVLSEPLRERVPVPYVALNPAAAADLKVSDGDLVEIVLAESRLRLPALLRPDLPPGVAGIPYGLPGVAWDAAFAETAEIEKVAGGPKP